LIEQSSVGSGRTCRNDLLTTLRFGDLSPTFFAVFRLNAAWEGFTPRGEHGAPGLVGHLAFPIVNGVLNSSESEKIVGRVEIPRVFVDLGAWFRLPIYDCTILPPTENAVPQKYPQRNQLKHTKKRYRVRNWRGYEAGLCKRGDLTIWFFEDALRDWHPSVGAKPGGQRHYSDTAIETALTVRAVHGLALRQTGRFPSIGRQAPAARH
jgi:hypothetical protein